MEDLMPNFPPLPRELRARILLLEATLAIGALILGVIVLYIGVVLIRGNVHDQLRDQQITFTPADKLSDEEKSWKSGSQCLVDNAGQQLTTGDQARCYSDYYILLHMTESAEAAGYPGATYATLGTEQTNLRVQVADAKARSDAAATTAAQQKLDAVSALRSTLQSGTSLRGQLLNAWGWDTLGTGVIVGGVAVLLLAAVFGAAFAFELTHKSAQ
jgi:hypothetical protein